MADEFDSMTDEQLSALRGDETPAPTPEPEAPETAPEPEAEPEPVAKNYMIPKSRYDAVMGRLRAAEAKLNEQRAAPPSAAPAPAAAPPEPSLDERLHDLDNQYTQAIADGQYEQAAKLMGQARALERQAFGQALKNVASVTKNEASSETREQLRYDTLLAEVERALPQVAPNSDAYDDGLVAEISRLANAFERIGERPADALEQALRYVFPAGWRETKAKPGVASRTTNVQKNIASAKAIPPKMSAGENSDKAGMTGKIDIMKLSDAELEKLTDAQLAALRGDNF